VTVTLRDGSRVDIRPLEPDDRALLVAGFERLSPESRYRRFFGPMPHLRSRDVEYLTNVDHHDHEALVAVDPDTGDGVGVARYVRTGPGVAEPALVVVDDWQGRGLGSRLLDRLVERAQDEGVTRFEAPVLADNPEAIRVFERLGRTTIVPRARGRAAHRAAGRARHASVAQGPAVDLRQRRGRARPDDGRARLPAPARRPAQPAPQP
jgi:GNAT superfamily N-acetyltransferase